MHNLNLSTSLSNEIHQKAENFRKNDKFMLYAREYVRKVDSVYRSESGGKKLPPKIPARGPTTKANPRGRGIGADTRNKLDEQTIARQKLEELNESRRIDKEGVVRRNESFSSGANHFPLSPGSERNAVYAVSAGWPSDSVQVCMQYCITLLGTIVRLFYFSSS